MEICEDSTPRQDTHCMWKPPQIFVAETPKQIVCAMHRQTGMPPRAVALPGTFEVGEHGRRKTDGTRNGRKSGHNVDKSAS